MAYNPFNRSANARGTTWLGGVPRPEGTATPTTQLRSLGRNRGRSPGLSPVIGMAPGNYSMAPDDGRRISARPTFQNADAYYAARGSGLDWLETYGPRRGQKQTGMGQATYGGIPAGGSATPNNNLSTIGGGISGTNPYTELTGQPIENPVQFDNSPQGRYNRMGAEADLLLAQGLADGQAAVAEIQAMQNAQSPRSDLILRPTPTERGYTGRGRYGAASVYPYGDGPRKAFGSTGAPTPEQSRQDDIGDRAIASRNRAGISTQSLADAYSRRRAR